MSDPHDLYSIIVFVFGRDVLETRKKKRIKRDDEKIPCPKCGDIFYKKFNPDRHKKECTKKLKSESKNGRKEKKNIVRKTKKNRKDKSEK